MFFCLGTVEITDLGYFQDVGSSTITGSVTLSFLYDGYVDITYGLSGLDSQCVTADSGSNYTFLLKKHLLLLTNPGVRILPCQ